MPEPGFDNRVVPLVQHQEPNVNMSLSISLDDSEPGFDNRVVPFVQHQEPNVNMLLSISLDDFDRKSAKKKRPVSFRLFAVDIPVVISEELTSDKPDGRKIPNTTNGYQDILVDLTKEKRGKRKKPNTTNGDQVKRKKPNSAAPAEQEPEPEPEIPPRIMEKLNNIQDRGIMITGPVFLCNKKLEVSDVIKGQNRLFITKEQWTKQFEFLTDEEKAKLETGGFDVKAIDAVGNDYNLTFTKWPTATMPILRKEWFRMIQANGVHAGDFVELWGYRQNSKLCLAVNFKKDENAAPSMDAGSSNMISSVTD